MALFSKILEFFFGARPAFTEREFAFNRSKIQKEIVDHSRRLNDYARDQSHQVFVEYVRGLLNLEILRLSETKPATLDAYTYQKGRIDALRLVLDVREKALIDGEVAKKTHGEQGVKRSYVKTPATSAGLSI
jgi:hypothetical protein